MDTYGWSIALHTTDGLHYSYTLSRRVWRGAVRHGLGIFDIGNCLDEQLPRVLDQVVDNLLACDRATMGTAQDTLPY